MKTKMAIVSAIVLAGTCGIAWGQRGGLVREQQEIINRVYLRYPRPVSLENRIAEGKLYSGEDRALWQIKQGACLDVTADGIVVQQFEIEVERVYGPRKSSSLQRQGLVVGGFPSPRTVLSSKETKVPTQKIFLKNFPYMETVAEGKEVTAPAMLAGTVDVGGRRLECWDCGLPDTAENRKKARIPIPTPKQLAAAQEEIATALKELDERTRAAEQKAAEQEAAKKKAAEEAAAQQKAAKAATAEQRATEAAAARQQAAEAAAAKKKEPQLRALKWNMEQAAKGDSYGLLRMGQRYRDGDGVPKDLTKAREYFTKATAAGSPDAADALAKLNKLLTNSPAAKP